MSVRQLFIAGLCATASLAQAGPVEVTSEAPRFVSFAAGSTPMPSALSEAVNASLAGPGRWSMHSRLGDRGFQTTMLFAGASPKSAVIFGAPTTLPVVQAAPATAPVPAPTPAPVVHTPSVPLPVAEVTAPPVAHTPGESLPDVAVGTDHQVVLPPATDLVDAIRDLPGVTPIVDAPNAALVPEPATGLLMLAGFMGAGMLSRRRRK